jgi:nicotinic acid phosphoribosyltransferase
MAVRTIRSGSVGTTFQMAAAFGVGPSGGMPHALVLSLTAEERRARPHIQSWERGHPPYGLL